MVQHILPEPCSPEYLDEVEAWIELKEVHSKEQVMEEEFGDRIATPEEVTHLLLGCASVHHPFVPQHPLLPWLSGNSNASRVTGLRWQDAFVGQQLHGHMSRVA